MMDPVHLLFGMNWVDADHPDSWRAEATQKLCPKKKVLTVGKNHPTGKHHLYADFNKLDAFEPETNFFSCLSPHIEEVIIDYVFLQPNASYRFMYGWDWTLKLQQMFLQCPNLQRAFIPFRKGCMEPGKEPDKSMTIQRTRITDINWMVEHIPLVKATECIDEQLVIAYKKGKGNKTNDALQKKGFCFWLYTRKE